MCRSCRVEHYSRDPEPIPSRLDPFFWGDNDNYNVMPRIDNVAAMFMYREPDVIQLARKVRRGDVGIAAYLVVSQRACWVFSEPKNDATKRRQLLLRSLLYNRGLSLPFRSVARNTFFQSGHGDPVEIVKELDVEDWFKCCTNYNNPKEDVTHQLDPEGPETEKPPEAIWPMLDKMDMGHAALVYAAHTIVQSLRKEGNRNIEFELGLDELNMSADQVREIIDGATTIMTTEHNSESEGSPRTLSMLLEDELGFGEQ
ncbi:hypothetical protein BGW39_002178 [Mortierella sp. 14UC]|nr:hypothetical protein BGW39_002178 [Mortierella sp. 14UC]